MLHSYTSPDVIVVIGSLLNDMAYERPRGTIPSNKGMAAEENVYKEMKCSGGCGVTIKRIRGVVKSFCFPCKLKARRAYAIKYHKTHPRS